MGPATRHLIDTITYWGPPPPGTHDGFGYATYDTPIEIKGRWEESTNTIQGPDGEQVVSGASVFVGIDLEVNGYLYNGVSVAADPTTVEGAKEIVQFTKIPDLRRIETERRAYL